MTNQLIKQSNNQSSADGCCWREKEEFSVVDAKPKIKEGGGGGVISCMPVNRGNNKRFVAPNDIEFGFSDHTVRPKLTL